MKYKDKENVRLVELDQLSFQKGEILELVEDDTIESVQDTTAVDQYNNPIYISKSFACKRVRALVGDNRDEEFENMIRERDDALQDKETGLQELGLFQQNIDEMTKTISERNDGIDALNARNNKMFSEITELVDKIRKYETDIGKLSVAFGELKIKEILDESI